MATLEDLRNTWDGLAQRDPLGAILTDPSRIGGKWPLAEFMATGDAEIDIVLKHLGAIGHVPSFGGAALDFGCGVGRLTHALARRFTSCIGLDISPHMIESARALNQDAHCRYLLLTGSVLPFPDLTFSFVYSNIVLQHLPRKYAARYLRELQRVLEPGGVLVFGVQDRFATPDLSSVVIRIRNILRIRSRLRSALGQSGGEMQMHCLPEYAVREALRSATLVDVQLTNTAAKDFNGRLQYLSQPPARGYVGKQYCVVKGR